MNCLSHGQQFKKFCSAFYTDTPSKFKLCSNWNLIICSNALILPYVFWHGWTGEYSVDREDTFYTGRCSEYADVAYGFQLNHVLCMTSHCTLCTWQCGLDSQAPLFLVHFSLRGLQTKGLSGVPWCLKLWEHSFTFQLTQIFYNVSAGSTGNNLYRLLLLGRKAFLTNKMNACLLLYYHLPQILKCNLLMRI